MNKELEQYRKQAIETLKQNAEFIKNTASDVLGLPCQAVYIVGSVLDRAMFREDSDVDVAVVVNSNKINNGVSEMLSNKLQNEMVRWPMGDVGVINTLVFVNELQLARGKSMKIATNS